MVGTIMIYPKHFITKEDNWWISDGCQHKKRKWPIITDGTSCKPYTFLKIKNLLIPLPGQLAYLIHTRTQKYHILLQITHNSLKKKTKLFLV